MKKIKQLFRNLRYLSTVDLKSKERVVKQLCKHAVSDGKMILNEDGHIMRERTIVE